jgi:NADPH-dependent 2,4-dienoyl-CoA reductase/sulfur reductase-like enzyme
VAGSGTLHEDARELPVLARADVLVVGGGTAGVAAAIAAARGGARVVLAEASSSLGGLATNGLIALLLTLDDGRGQQVIAGLCQELVERMTKLGGAFAPPPEHWGRPDPELVARYARLGLVWGGARADHVVRYSVAYDPEIMREVLNALATAAGVEVLFHVWGARALVDARRVVGVAFESRAGRQAITADVVIDATGDGHVLASAGCAFELERVHPWLWFRIGGVTDVDAAIAAGAPIFRTTNPGQALLPWGSVARLDRRIDATDPRELSYAELACRRLVMEEFRSLRAKFPELRDAHLCEIARLIGITESRRLVGRRVLLRADRQHPQPDAIAITGHWTKYGAVYAIPYGCLVPNELDNLLVTGRCISVDHQTHNATKEIPPALATGEAAGVAAGLALERNGRASDVDVAALQARLRARGAIVDYAF